MIDEFNVDVSLSSISSYPALFQLLLRKLTITLIQDSQFRGLDLNLTLWLS